MNKELSNLLNSLFEDIQKLVSDFLNIVEYLKKEVEKTEEKKKESVEEIIKRVCEEEGVPYKLAYWVAWAESKLDPYAINVNRDYSLDRGLFQWNSKWHPEVTNAQAFDPETATRLFCRAVKQGNLSWWNSSRHLWEPHVKDVLKYL